MPDRPSTMDLLLPAGATATVDGKDAGAERSFKFIEFDKNTEAKRVEVKVKYADGTEVQRSVEVRPNLHVRVPLSQSPVDAPTVVLTESPEAMLWAEFSPNGRELVTASEKGSVILWDVKAGRVVRSFVGHTAEVLTVTFSADGERLLTASADMDAILWNVRTGRVIRRFKGHTGTVTAAFFSGDEKKVITASGDKTAILWDAETGQQIRSFTAHKDEVVAVAISPDGKLVATGSTDKDLMVWNAETGESVFKFTTSDTVSGLEFTADGKFLGTSNFNNVATIYEVEGWKALGGTRRNNLDLNAIGFTPDGRRFYTAGKDAVARLWDTSTRQMLREFNGHGNDIQSVRPSRDGNMLVTASRDGTVRLFDHATGLEVATLATTNQGRHWAVVSPDGLYDASDAGRRMIGYRFSTTLPGATVDQFFQEFYHPGLLAEIMSGERPIASRQLGKQLPPVLKVTSPKPRTTYEDGKVELVVEAEDMGGGIGAPRIFNNGSRLAIEPAAKRDGKIVTYTYQLQLANGANQIKVVAGSEDGSWDSIPAEIDLSSTQRPERKPRLFVVAVGIGNYTDAKVGANRPNADAQNLANALQQRSTSLYDRVDVIALSGKDATKARLKETLADVASLSQSQDTVMLFVSGRGALVDHHLYFAPSDLRSTPAGVESVMPAQGIDADELAALLGTSRALNRVMVLDASSLSPTPATGKPDFGLRAAVERWSRDQGVYAIAAATSQPAQAQQGFLTGLLLESTAVGTRVAPGQIGAGDSMDVLDWFNRAAERAAPALDRLKLDPQSVQQSTKLKSFPILVATK